MVHVYFGCSMRGGYPNVSIENITKIVESIKDLGYELMSEHQVKDGVETDKKKHDSFVHDRDYDWMTESDVGIFEVSNPSLGVGAEIADMLNMKKPVLCLFKRGIPYKVSSYVMGKTGSKHIKTPIECYEYDTIGDAKYAIKKFVKENVKKD